MTNNSKKVTQKLGSLRSSLRTRLIGEGLCWMVLCLVCLVFVTLGFDYTLRLDRPLRIVICAICFLALVWTTWRFLLAPLRVNMDDISLAQLMERHFKNLGDRLVSSLQLDPATVQAGGISGDMVRHVQQEAYDMAGGLKVSDVINPKRLYKAIALMILGLVLVGGMTAARPDIMNLWFQRNVLFQNIDWPQDTNLSVFYVDRAGNLQPLLKVDREGNVLTVESELDVLRGGDLKVVVETADGSEVPDFVTFHVWYPSVGDTEENVDRAESVDVADVLGPQYAKNQRGCFIKTFPSVSETLKFYVTGGDDRRDSRVPHQVRLINPPAMTELRFYVLLHSYMRQPGRRALDGSRGVLSLPLGSTVIVEGTANKDIASAEVMLDGKSAGEMEIKKDAEGRPRLLEGRFELMGDNEPRTVNLKFNMVDTAGYSNQRSEQYIVQITPDQPPMVLLESYGVRDVVCPTARIPLKINAKDDHGASEVLLGYELTLPDEGGDTPKSQPARLMIGAPMTSNMATDPRDLKGERLFDIQPLKLEPGSSIRVRGDAKDFLPASFKGPNKTQSNELTFRVISTEELLGQIVGKQREAAMEFFQAMGIQQMSRGYVEAANNQLLEKKITSGIQSQLRDAQAMQQRVFNEVTKATDALEAVAIELEFNRAGKEEDIRDLKVTVVQPMRQLLRDMQTVLALFPNARELTDPAAMRKEGLDIAQRQDALYAEMQNILPRIRKMANRVELARRLEGLLQMSVKLKKLIEEKSEGDIDDIFKD